MRLVVEEAWVSLAPLLAAVAVSGAPDFVAPTKQEMFVAGLTGRGALAIQERVGLRHVTDRGSRLILGAPRLLGAAGTGRRVIAATGSYGMVLARSAEPRPPVAFTTPPTVYAGSIGALRVVARCGRVPAAGAPPVAAHGVLAYRGCDGRTVRTAAGERWAATGPVVALGAGDGSPGSRPARTAPRSWK